MQKLGLKEPARTGNVLIFQSEDMLALDTWEEGHK